jgi:transposase
LTVPKGGACAHVYRRRWSAPVCWTSFCCEVDQVRPTSDLSCRGNRTAVRRIHKDEAVT